MFRIGRHWHFFQQQKASDTKMRQLLEQMNIPQKPENQGLQSPSLGQPIIMSINSEYSLFLMLPNFQSTAILFSQLGYWLKNMQARAFYHSNMRSRHNLPISSEKCTFHKDICCFRMH